MSQGETLRQVTKKELSAAVKKSHSYSEILQCLEVSHRSGNNLNLVKEKIKEYGLSVGHFGPYETIYKNQDKLREAVKNNISIAAVLEAMGFRPSGGNYASVRKWVKHLNIDVSHFKGQRHGKSGFKTQIPLDEILVEYSNYSSSQLKKRLIKEGLLKDECCKCGQKPFWNEQVLVLQLDHINGIHTDNRIDNLRILCPNCHAQTTTFNRKKFTPL